MATRDSVEELVQQADITLEKAQKQLEVTNRNGFEIDNEYSDVQRQLSEVAAEIENMMTSANHQQREQLHRLKLQVNGYLNDMILDQVDLKQFE
ncbi:DUF2524 family protein [Aquibacillus sediminis]|uniref:DUF2524 family protein n=1 Tax=Aquibacillus sediminis TaxID=2574734 RepID=UPI001485EBD6|nr:DUF2524 family protein [Aquibacillus sediminis]